MIRKDSNSARLRSGGNSSAVSSKPSPTSSIPSSSSSSPSKKRRAAIRSLEDSTRLFGVPLFDAAIASDPKHGLIPSPIAKAVEFLDIAGVETEGLYRVPPSTIILRKYRSAFDSGQEVDFFKAREDPHNVAGVVKAYLTALPEPLFTNKLLQAFKNLGGIEDKQVLHRSMTELLFQIPPPNRETIGCLARHMKNVANHSRTNKMTASNLATSIGPQYAVALEVMIDECEFIPSTIVFGVPLQIAAERSDPEGVIPSPVRICIEFLEKPTKEGSRLDAVGLYKDMSLPSIAQLYKFDAGVERLFGQFTDPLSVANILKLYISSLPESLLTAELETKFILAADNGKGKESAVEQLQSLVKKLPESNFETLKFLCRHFAKLMLHSDTNKLTAAILAERWGGAWASVLPPLIENFEAIFEERLERSFGGGGRMCVQWNRSNNNNNWMHSWNYWRQKDLLDGGTEEEKRFLTNHHHKTTGNGHAASPHLRGDKVRSMVLEFLAERWAENRPVCTLGRDCDNTDPTHFIKLQHTL